MGCYAVLDTIYHVILIKLCLCLLKPVLGLSLRSIYRVASLVYASVKSFCCLACLLGEAKFLCSICPCTEEFNGLKFPVSCLGFLYIVIKERFDGFALLPVPPLFLPFPPRCALLKDSGKRGSYSSAAFLGNTSFHTRYLRVSLFLLKVLLKVF